MAEEATQAQGGAAAAEVTESDFSALLQKEFRPRTEAAQTARELDMPYVRLKLKFSQKRQARIAVNTLAKGVVPVPSRQTCVVYGD